ncbi:MAG TPA: nuclear transport factor 2 family protein, partial [Acidimicrobiales bacterium]|nr:nuclear transport factor 2 family protein [Acidimicrobiales bacterium]
MGSVDDLAAEVAALRRRVEVSEGVLAIQALKARYGELVDMRFRRGSVVDAPELARIAHGIAALFTPDGVWDGGPGLGRAVGRPEIAERLGQPTLRFSRHFFMNPRIEVEVRGDGDTGAGAMAGSATATATATATARWDLLSPCRRADGTSYWMSGYEDDEYALVDGVWLCRS